MTNEENDSEDSVLTTTQQEVRPPSKYKVLLHNDDYTTMEFVIEVLQQFFQKSYPEAQEIMWKVHHEGVGICGIYSFEVAETKASKVGRYAREKGHPLKCSIEPCD